MLKYTKIHRNMQVSLQSLHALTVSILSHLHIPELQHVVCVLPLVHLHLGGDATHTTDHVVVVPHGQTLKGPVATNQQLLDMCQLLRTQSVD